MGRVSYLRGSRDLSKPRPVSPRARKTGMGGVKICMRLSLSRKFLTILVAFLEM